MSEVPINNSQDLETPRLSPDEIADLKSKFLNTPDLVEYVAAAMAMEGLERKLPAGEYGRAEELEIVAFLGAQGAKVITELIALPGSEWADGYISPEIYAEHAKTQEMALQSRLISDEQAALPPMERS